MSKLKVIYYGPTPFFSDDPIALYEFDLTKEQAKRYKESEEGEWEIIEETYGPDLFEDYDHELIED